MRFKGLAAANLTEITTKAELKTEQFIRDGYRIVDVDFFIDDTKMFPYRAVIKYERNR